ncbi:MAG TPA: RES family NAD+ phosphorylase [Candidatus Saccharimonadales bacterium]|nr:RES family NAD+ phosphorylase [Candidatus Saccharimonadales bacterium]
MSLTITEQASLRNLTKRWKPLSGVYFRSVERRFMDPSQVLNGRGTELYGGRFAPVGTKGVYLADSDVGASAEVLARKSRLGNASQISLDKYPRVVFALDVELDRVVSLVRRPRNPELASIREKSLENDLRYSQSVGQFLANAGIQGLLFKSTVAAGSNLLIFLDNCIPGQLKIRRLDEMMDTLSRIVTTYKA